jgi:hypothetical protein
LEKGTQVAHRHFGVFDEKGVCGSCRLSQHSNLRPRNYDLPHGAL